jgi:plasmid stabilization system protein ParE
MLVQVSDRAEADYLAIVEYLANFSATTATSFIEDYERAQASLREFPRIGMARPQPHRRVLHFGRRYHLEYELRQDRVILRRVKDGRRQAD